MTLETPILFLIFNRPDVTQRVFEAIEMAKPSKLFIASDGPRPDRPDDSEMCRQTRQIIEKIDWNCDVSTLFRENNLGCKKAVSSAIDWFFTQVNEGIILEDDCLPDISFFQYCEALLQYYRYDSRIMQICGLNVLNRWNRWNCSYYFSNYGPIWGWATWHRAWKYYDVDMRLWPQIKREKRYKDFSQHDSESDFRLKLYDDVYSGKIDTWDYQWGFAKMINSGLSVIPSVNLISNIGFGKNGTHTTSNSNSPYSAMHTDTMSFPLHHPEYIIRDGLADHRYVDEFMTLPERKSIRRKIIHFFNRAKK